MEQEVQNVEVETTNTENVETQTTEQNEVAEKKFTQKEFDEALQKAVHRKTKNMPSDEELKSFAEWKESKKTESEKQQEKEKEYQNTLHRNEELMKENLLLKKGVKFDDIDYVIYKVSKMDGDFEENLETYLESNKKFTDEPVQKATGSLATKQNNSSSETGVSAILKAKHPELFD